MQGFRGDVMGKLLKTIDRHAYAEMYGPTTGDRVRLADTDLVVEIERDHTVYGEEVKFGGGKVIRDGMGQSQRAGADVADLVITNAVVIDPGASSRPTSGFEDGRISAHRQGRKPRRAAGRRPSSSVPAPRCGGRGLRAHGRAASIAHPLHLARNRWSTRSCRG